ncbi:MAG TPA: alpha/beta hydrolase [Bacillaceae bacterium]
MKIINGIATSLNRDIPFSLFKHEKLSEKLAIILPGAGYSTQAPLLHFTKGVFFNRGFDVLQVNYSYLQDVLSSLSEEEFTADVLSAIEKAASNDDYSQYTFIAKSIGTIALTYLLQKPNFQSANAVWLTPLLKREDVYNALMKNDNHGVCIIGDKDPHYITTRFEAILNNKSLRAILINDADHSLEVQKDLLKSIEILKEVITKLNEF